jgi:nucleoside-diphosphate-sugar epimerase
VNILVTGGTGFIGQHVLRLLCDGSNNITAFRRRESILPSWETQNINWLESPLDSIDGDAFEGIETLLHMASVGVSPKIATYEELVYWNVSSLFRIIDQAKKAGVRRIIITGTFAEYGLSANSFKFLAPTAPLLPLSPYAASKAAGYTLAAAYAVENQVELCYLRIFSAYGEGQFLGNFWPSLKSAAINGEDFPMTFGEQIRDYIAVELVAEEIRYSVFRNDLSPGIPLIKNVASGSPITMRKFAETWWSNFEAKGRLLVGSVPYRKNEPMRFAADLNEFFLNPNE